MQLHNKRTTVYEGPGYFITYGYAMLHALARIKVETNRYL